MELIVQNLVTGNKQCEWNVNTRPRIESKSMCVMMVHDNTGEIRRQSLIGPKLLPM
jgi:hypothetical protein